MQVKIALSKAEKTMILMGLEKRTGGCANPASEEYCRRTKNFLLINRLKTNVPVGSPRDGVGIAMIPVSRIWSKMKIKPGV